MAATRVFVSVSSRSQYWTRAIETAEGIGEVALDILENNDLLPQRTAPKFIAEEKFATRTHLVFDIFHDDYQPENGHLPGQDELPVLHVQLGKKENASIPGAAIQRQVNSRIRELHDLTGIGSVPPFFVDYSSGQTPTFWNPRTMKRVENSSAEGPTEDDDFKAPHSSR